MLKWGLIVLTPPVGDIDDTEEQLNICSDNGELCQNCESLKRCVSLWDRYCMNSEPSNHKFYVPGIQMPDAEYEIESVKNVIIAKRKNNEDTTFEEELLKVWSKVKGYESAKEALKEVQSLTKRTRIEKQGGQISE